MTLVFLDASHDILLCQICQSDISGLDDVARQQHYNRCLDGPGSTGGGDTGSTVAEAQGAGVDREGSAGRSGLGRGLDGNDSLEGREELCPVCHRNLSHMNSSGKTQHINRCMDKVSHCAIGENLAYTPSTNRFTKFLFPFKFA